jgi:hypothetical protein
VTLEELLALLPDNTTGAIDAEDLRVIVAELYTQWASNEARITAVEASGGEISADGVWQFNPIAGAVPQSMQLSVDVIPITDASWVRFWPVDLNNQDMRNFITTAKKVYTQQENDGANWAYYNVTGPATDNGTYVQLPIELISSSGSSTTSQWQRVLIVLTMPSATADGE